MVIEFSPSLLTEEGVLMSETLLAGVATAGGDTGPEVTPLGEGRMVREDCWRQVHRLFHVEQRSKAEIARQLGLDRKTVRAILQAEARRWDSIAQPTTRRLHASSTTARYRKPVHVGTYVMSATNSRSGPVAVNWRSTRSGAGRAVSSRTVVWNGLRRLTPCTPAFRMSRATRFRPIWRPRAASSAWMRGAPYEPRDIR